MAAIKVCNLLLLLFTVILLVEGCANEGVAMNCSPYGRGQVIPDKLNEEVEEGRWRRRKMIGSTAPICTYNECRGCKYRCRAEQVPVEGNDPIHSSYHYRCVCHR